MADEKPPDSERPNQIGIYYQRSRHYRTIHADGAQMGITPRAAIQFTLYSDQKPMPEFALHEITSDGNLGKVLEEVIKGGVIREVEVNVVMDVAVATSFVTVLQGLLTQAKSLQEQASKNAEQQVPAVPADSE